MKVIIELEISDCKKCPHFEYKGTSWGEDVYVCNKLDREVSGDGIHDSCPYIKSTMEKLWNKNYKQ